MAERVEKMKKILIIEDDERIAGLESDYLEASGLKTTVATDGQSGLQHALNEDYNLIMLDIMLPGINGLEICRAIRKNSNVPIILVSAKKEDLDKIKGLGVGADDYVVKPFSPSELVARVLAHINRYERLTSQGNQGKTDRSVIDAGNLHLDANARQALLKGKEVALTNKEFDLIFYLAVHPDTVFSKDELFNQIWRYDSMGETSTVTVHVNRIRDKFKEIDPDTKYIYTVWGRGYRFKK